MGAVKNAFHDEIIWNGMDEDERQDAVHFASADTHPKDGDVEQAPLVSGAVPKADAHD